MQDWSKALSPSFPVPGSARTALKSPAYAGFAASGDPSSLGKWLNDPPPSGTSWLSSQAVHKSTCDTRAGVWILQAARNQFRDLRFGRVSTLLRLYCIYTVFNPWLYTDNMQYYSGIANVTSSDLGSLKIAPWQRLGLKVVP